MREEIALDKSRKSSSNRRKQRSRFRKLRNILLRRSTKIRIALIIIISIIVFSLLQVVLIIDATNQLNIAYVNFDRVYSGMSRQQSNDLKLADFDRLSSSIDVVSDSLDLLNSRLKFIRPFVGFNQEWALQIGQLDTATLLVKSTKDMLNGVRPVLFYLVGESQDTGVVTHISAGTRIIELLEIGRGQFLSASTELEQAQVLLSEIRAKATQPEIVLQIEQIENFYVQLTEINNFLLQSPELLTFVLGLDEERSYLLMATNNDEIRPSGGYMSTYGWLVVRDGRIIDYDYSPTTSTSPIPPTDQNNLEVNIPDWWIQYEQPIFAAWDGSWYADYPSTAEMAIQYYNGGNNLYSPVDGAISIDIIGFQYILSALGSVELPEYGRVVTQDNFREIVYDIRAFGEGVTPHKRFVSDVFKTIFMKWQAIGSNIDQNNELVNALLKGLQERHIMLYFTDSAVNGIIDQLKWSGAQEIASNNDYLMVVDANLGNKSNHSIIRQFTYDIIIELDGTAKSTLTVHYDYPAVLADKDPAVDSQYHGSLDYGNLLQIFTPLGTILNGTDGINSEISIDESFGYTDFITRFGVDYNTSKRVQFKYETPQVVESIGVYDRYRLHIQKQPGSITERINIQVSLPADTEIISSSPLPIQEYRLDNLILDYRLDLDSDQWIEITYKK